MTATQTTFPEIALIGGGQMARALIGGWCAKGASPRSITVADPSAAQREWLGSAFPGLKLEADNALAAGSSKVWLLAVKPQMLAGVARALEPVARSRRPLVISIAAGIRAADLSRWLGPGATVVRAMPNRPALVGLGVSALCAAPAVPEAARAVATELMQAVGSVVWVGSEAELDAVTAVSGSGPAYFFLLIEALEAAALAEGLSPAVARRLALDTAAGASRMAAASTDDPATLREQVTSKAGTTAAALAVFEAADLRGIVARAVAAAARRSREMAEEFGRDTPQT